MNKFDIKDGEYTSTIYGLIKEQRFNDAITILTFIYDTNPSSRAALSLLAYCHYYMQVSTSSQLSLLTNLLQDYVSAANCYEQLSLLYPEEEEYKVYYGQSLYNATLYEEAMKVTVTVEAPEYQGSMQKLQAAIR